MYTNKIKRIDMINCSLCHDAPCTAACKGLDPASALRSIWFDNEDVAALRLPEENLCAACSAPCEEKCIHSGRVPVKELMMRLYDEVMPGMSDKSITCLEQTGRTGFAEGFRGQKASLNGYLEGGSILRSDICGIPLENPFLLSSSVVSSSYDMCARAFEAGWAGAVFKTVCSFEIHECSPRFGALPGSAGGFIGFKNIEQLSEKGVEKNMEMIRKLKADYPAKALIVSYMGQNEDEWGALAGICEENGADAVELNFSCPNMADGDLGSSIGQIPGLVETFTAAAKNNCKIPVIAKLTPNVANMSEAAEAAKRGGADGIAAINTVKSVMGLDPETFVSAPDVNGMSAAGGYSGNAVKPIALRFIAEMGNNSRLSGMHISGMGGIETWRDALDFLLLGAGSLQVTTAVMKYGYRIIDDFTSGLAHYLERCYLAASSALNTENGRCRHAGGTGDKNTGEKGTGLPVNVKNIVGLGLPHISDTTDALERDTVVFPLIDKSKCAGCGRCVISCSDGGHQALTMKEDRSIKLDGTKCVGCHLCALVCPEGAIKTDGKRIQRQ